MRSAVFLVSLSAVAAGGCSGKAGLAAANVGIGAIASGVSRASGGCFAMCVGREICNPATGFCESDPCEACSSVQHCEWGAALPRCVDNPIPTSLTRKGKAADAPLVVPFEPLLTPVPEGQQPPQH